MENVGATEEAAPDLEGGTVSKTIDLQVVDCDITPRVVDNSDGSRVVETVRCSTGEQLDARAALPGYWEERTGPKAVSIAHLHFNATHERKRPRLFGCASHHPDRHEC